MPEEEFLSKIAAPARRALENAGIKTLNQLSKMSGADILDCMEWDRDQCPSFAAF